MQYNEFAYIYDDLMHQDIEYDKICDFIENQLVANGCEADSICELACGTGNVTEILENRGFDMTGVDISSDMIEVAERKLKNSTLMCIDMSKFNPFKKYDAFLCMIDGINYVIDPLRVQRIFKTIYDNLNKNGVFIFDVSSSYKLEHIIRDNTFIHSEYDVFYSWQNEYIPKYKLSHMLLNFFVKDGEHYKRFEEEHVQRGWNEKELRYMLKTAGFKTIKTYNGFTDTAPLADSERIVFVCK